MREGGEWVFGHLGRYQWWNWRGVMDLVESHNTESRC